MIKVLINEEVKKYFLSQPISTRKKLREKFEFLENGIWDGGLRVKKIKSTQSKYLFEARTSKAERILFSLGRDKARENFPLIYVWGILSHDELSKKIKTIIPSNVPFLNFAPYNEEVLDDLDVAELPSDYFTELGIEERITDESGVQRWYPIYAPEWQRIEEFKKNDFELFLYLTQEQDKLLKTPLPIMLSGTAGSGKTTLAIYYLFKTGIKGKTKLFLTYNTHLRDFAAKLYGGLVNENKIIDITPPNFFTFKDLCLEITRNSKINFDNNREVDFERFNELFSQYSSVHKHDSILVWEEIRSIIKGALPQLNLSQFDYSLKKISQGYISLPLLQGLTQQFLTLANLESVKEIDGIIGKYLQTDTKSFIKNISKIVEEKRERVVSILESTITLLKRKKAISEQRFLSYLDYEILGKKKAPNFVFNRKDIYTIFKWYQDRIERDGLWDELDLARETINVVSAKSDEERYDIVICDEVQDLTDVHIDLLFYLLKDPNNLFLAGDTKQIINPSGFRWEETKRHFFERNLKIPSINFLSLNFRSSGSIVELSNELLEIKESHLGSSWSEVKEEWKYKGRPPIIVKDINEKKMLECLEKAGANRTILVRNELEKNKLKETLGTELVFTIREAKGLEFGTVVLWKFVSHKESEDIWKTITNVTKRDVHSAKIKHEINLLYVGITRAQRDLIIFDGSEVSIIWENDKIGDKVFISSDINYIEKVWNVISTPSEWIEQGNYFFIRKYYKAAMECFKNGGDEKLFEKAAASHYEIIRDYRQAAFYCEKLGEFERTAINYEKDKDFKKALEMWELLENKNKIFECTLLLLIQNEEFEKAGNFLFLNKDYNKAVEYYIKARKYNIAADIYINKLKKQKEAATLYEQAGDFESAAILYHKLKLIEKAALLYERVKKYDSAEKLWKKMKRTDELIRMYEFTNQHDKLLIIYEKKRDVNRAVKSLRLLKIDEKKIRDSADTLFSNRKYFASLVRYLVIKENNCVAKSYFELKSYKESVKYFEIAKNHIGAGDAYVKLRDYKNAFLNYLNSDDDKKENHARAIKVGDYIRDYNWFHDLGNRLIFEEKAFEKALIVYKIANDPAREGICYVFLGKKDLALLSWDKVSFIHHFNFIANFCIVEKHIATGAEFFLKIPKNRFYALSRQSYNGEIFKPEYLIEMMDKYFISTYNKDDELLNWVEKLSLVDENFYYWEKVISYRERIRDYNGLLKYIGEVQYHNKSRHKEIRSRFMEEINNYKKMENYEATAFRLIVSDKYKNLEDTLRQIKIDNYNCYLFAFSKDYMQIAEQLIDRGQIEGALYIYKHNNKHEMVATIYEKIGQMDKAADSYLDAGKVEKSISLYKKIEKYDKIGDLYFYRFRDYPSALAMYLANKPQNRMRIAETYEKMNNFKKALDIWNELGNKRKVNSCLKKLPIQDKRQLNLF